VKIYAAAVEALRKKETGFFAGFCLISPGFGKLRVLVLCFPGFTENSNF